MKTSINILATEKLKEWNYTVLATRVCDKPTRNEGCLSLSRRVDCNYKRQVRERSESPYKQRRLRTRINGNKSQRYRAAFSMLTSEALPIIGVPPVPISVVRSIGIRRSPLPIDGITPETRSSACHFRSTAKKERRSLSYRFCNVKEE